MAGGLWHWGVDVGINTAAICAIRADRPRRAAFVQPKTKTSSEAEIWERLDGLMNATERLALELQKRCPPLAVMVEQPIGRAKFNPHLQYAAAALGLGVYRALEGLTPYPVSTLQVPVSTWKKEIVGKGNADKEDVMRWALIELKGEVDDRFTQDQADAYGIARYAAAVVS